jgi:hypothetical protein
MNNATRTLLLIFLVLSGLTALHMAFGGRRTSEAFSTSVVSIDSAKITRVVVERPGKPSLELKRTGDTWSVSENNGNSYPADRTAISNAIGEIQNMKVKALVTRDTAKFSRFQVDSTGTTVRFFARDKQKDAIVLGKFNFVNRSEFNTYVRNASKNEVFAAEGFLSSTFGRELDNWRDKHVWKLDEKQIRQVELQFPGDSSWAAFRADGNKWLSVNDTLDSYKIDNLVRQVAAVLVSQFDENVTPENAGEQPFTVKVTLDNGTSRTLKLGQHPEDGAYYRGTALDYPYVFRLSRSSWETGVLRSRKHFLKK